jgi:hypothetical protein
MVDYLRMAKIEKSIVDEYRPSLLSDCPAAAFIRSQVAEYLEDACKSRPHPIFNTEKGKKEWKKSRKFTFADQLKLDTDDCSEELSVDVEALKVKLRESSLADTLTTEAISVLKKVEALKGAAAFPNSRNIDGRISEAVTNLKAVIVIFPLLPSFILTSFVPR